MARTTAEPKAPALSQRELNRALLARQMLLERARLDPARAIERLGALQAQWAPAPYVALWSRLAPFAIADLERAITDRRVVKATLMRGTLHLVSARDYPYFAISTAGGEGRAWTTAERALLRQYAAVARAQAANGRGFGDAAKLHRETLRFAAKPRSREEIAALIAERTKMPQEQARSLLWSFIAAHGGFVQPPPSGLWTQRRAGELVAARSWLREMGEPNFEEGVVRAVRRYLAAFGPATVGNISSWTSIRTPPIREALNVLGGAVRTFRDERGRVLYDLARAPRPPADVAAPVRFLPKWDSTLLAYEPADRVRILPQRHHKSVIIKNGDVAQTFLVDGLVAGTWVARGAGRAATLSLEPLGRLARNEKTALVEEGERLLRFVAPEARSHEVRVASRR